MEHGERVAAARRRRYGEAVRGESVSITSRAPAALELLRAASCPYGLASRTQRGAYQSGGYRTIRNGVRGRTRLCPILGKHHAA
jgi:hypothetical protein